MSIVAVISTPEKGGNTEAVVNAIAESAKANGKDVQTFYLNPMANKKGCQACFACKAKGKCVQKDDLTPVLDAIRDAEGIILSTPVYFGEACGQYRMLEDRFFGFLDGSFQLNMPAGKKVAVVVAAGSAGADVLANKIEGVMTGFFKCQSIGKITFNTSNAKTFAAENADIMAQAAEIGKKF
ncbi:MAG: flavodoxin family protein [archaeon]|nr:flavodoxin family protein [archaeon]